jgi:hypothetical protein
MHASFTRIFADEAGVSHFEDLSVELIPGFAVPPAEPLHVAPFVATTECSWVGFPHGWDGVAHPAPRRSLFVILQGEADATTGDGDRRRFGPGSVILLEDTWGTGHAAHIISSDGIRSLVFTVQDTTKA